MTLTRTFGPFLCLAALLPGCAHGGSPRWYHFDGTRLTDGRGTAEATIAIQPGKQPAMATETGLRPLLPGTGALAAFLYRQVSGGKLTVPAGTEPLAALPVTITGNGEHKTVTTNAAGYLLLPLPTGDYQLTANGMIIPLTVRTGETTLKAVRVGKRMVD